MVGSHGEPSAWAIAWNRNASPFFAVNRKQSTSPGLSMIPLNAAGNVATAFTASGVSFGSASRTFGNGDTRRRFGLGADTPSLTTANGKSPSVFGRRTLSSHAPFGSPRTRTFNSSPAGPPAG